MSFNHPPVFSWRFFAHVLLQTFTLSLWLYLCGILWLDEKRLALWLVGMGGSGFIATLGQLLFL